MHGLSADKTAWLNFTLFLKNKYRMIVPDLIGHGESSYSPEQKYNSDSYVQCCKALMAHLDIQEYSVVGNSMGGTIAALLLSSGKEQCKNAVIIGPAGAKTDLTLHMIKERYNPFLHDDVAGVMEMYKLVMHKKPFIPNSVLHYFAHQSYLSRQSALKHLFDDFVNMDNIIDEALDVNPKNVLMIWGEEDYFAPTTDIEKWKSITSGATIIYPDIGHMTQLECPKQTAQDVHEFLSH